MEINEMIDLYNRGLSTSEIAKLTNYKTAKSIGDKLKQSGLILRTSSEAKKITKSYSDDIFEHLDADWKAYYLGLLLTDGWITHRKSGPEIVGYSTVDKEIADFLSKCIGKDYQVVTREPGIGPSGKTINKSTEYRIVLNSKKMVKDLVRFAVIPQKTYKLKGPLLHPEELKYLTYIMRGIIDGDGTLGFPSSHPSTMYFRIVSASEAFIDWCIWALEVLGMRQLRKRKITDTLWELNSAKPENISILALSIYRGSFGLTRKSLRIQNHFINHTMAALLQNSEKSSNMRESP